jgi:nucleoside-diphosphate-sugar epimerase
MRTIVITGGCGFIAKGIIKALYHKDTRIICIDNFVSSSEQEFISFLQRNNLTKNVTCIKMDICKKVDLDFYFDSFTMINDIFHLASIASPPLYKKFPLETLDVGYIGTKNILDIAKKFNSRLLFASTSEVYGDPIVNPQPETYYGNVNSFGERSCYDCSKRVGEALCFSYLNEYNMDIKIARIFNTYGTEMDLNDGRIITETMKHLINESTLVIYGDGEQTRSICYISDTVDMLIDLINSDCNIPVNIGNDNELTVNQIVLSIENVYGKVVDKVYVPLTQNDPMVRKPCLDLNKKVLGKRTFISTKDGITRMLESYIKTENKKND